MTSKCTSKEATILGRNVQVIDTPGLYDTESPNDVVKKEITKCIGMSSPGPHCFLLVLGLCRFTEEEKQSIYKFVDFFGNNAFNYFIVLFTRKDDLIYDKKTLDDHLLTVPYSLNSIIRKCKNRCIAFNNRALGYDQQKQVEELFNMIDDMIRKNGGDFYTNKMYIEAEKMIKHREEEIRRKRREEMAREKKKLKDEFEQQYIPVLRQMEIRAANTKFELEMEKQKNAKVSEINRQKEMEIKKRDNQLKQEENDKKRKEMEIKKKDYQLKQAENDKKRMYEEFLKIQRENQRSAYEERERELKRQYEQRIQQLEEFNNRLPRPRYEVREEVENESNEGGFFRKFVSACVIL